MSAVQKGQRWTEIRDAVGTWLRENVQNISVGRSIVQIPNVPFDIRLERDDMLPPTFTVSRILDSTLRIPEELSKSISRALEDKNDQLAKYKEHGNHTILILESQDIALVSSGSIYMAFLEAHGQIQPANIDQVWLVNTYEAEPEPDYVEILCLLADQDFMDLVNPQNAMLGPRYAEHWKGPQL